MNKILVGYYQVTNMSLDKAYIGLNLGALLEDAFEEGWYNDHYSAKWVPTKNCFQDWYNILNWLQRDDPNSTWAELSLSYTNVGYALDYFRDTLLPEDDGTNERWYLTCIRSLKQLQRDLIEIEDRIESRF